MKSITQRRIFSLLLSLAMLIGLLPALGSIASAAGSGTTEGDPRIVTTYAELSSALSSGVTYVKLGANINTKDFNDGAGYNKSIQQTGTVQLDLDGYSVTFFSRTSPLPAAIRVTGDLSVKDSRGGGKLYIDANPNTASSKQVLILAETGSFTLNSGRIGVDNGLAKNSIVVVEGKGDAKVVFNGGKVDAISPKVGIPYVYSALLSSNCKAEFNGGEFEGLVGFTYATRTDGKSKPNAVINAGKFKGGIVVKKGSETITDGKFTTTTNYLTKGQPGEFIEADYTNGWTIIDFGAIYSIESVQVSLWHDNKFTHAAVQLSTSADFSTGVTTIYSNNDEIAPKTTDETAWANGNANGKTFKLETPVAARYIRVTGRRQPANSKYCMINEIVVNKALRAEIPAFGSYMVEAADQDGFEYERSLTAANGMTFDAILAKLPARLRLVDSNDQIGVYNGTWVCESYTKGDAGETREGDYHFRFVVEEGVENAPVDLYGVTDIVVTVAGVADVGDLQAAIAAAEAKTQADYTASSYAAMTAVLTEAKALADRDVKSQAEVDAMEAKLTAAVQALIEKGDVTALRALCESLAGKKETDYTASSWKPFAEAMAAAKALVDDPDDAGKEAIAAAKEKLEEAELAARGDVAALKGAYEANQRELGVDSADRRYTRQTWTDYLAAMADALAVVTDNSDSDQTAVDALLSALNASKAALVVRADTAEFAAVVAQYRAEEKQYSKASWEDFALVLRDTESALSGEDLSQEELDKVIAAFEEAAEKLVRLGDTARLNALIATEVDVSACTAKSVLAYVTALEQARLVANGISSETEVNAAYDALKNAIDSLEKRGDKTELSALLEEAKGYEVIGTPLAEAMNAARDVLDDADASEREVSAAYEVLSAAMQNNKADDSCKSMLGAGSILASALALAAAVLLKKRFSVKK